jgi:predicted chitinase
MTKPEEEQMGSLEQIHAIFRNLKWIIAISLLLSGLLFFPNQVIELYRISAIEGGSTTIFLFVSILVMAFSTWLGALQVAAETERSIGQLAEWPARTIRYLPAVLGSLPLYATAAALFASRPSLEKVSGQLRQVGSVFRIQYDTLLEVKSTLILHGLLLLSIAFLTTAAMSLVTSRVSVHSARANNAYFIRRRFFLATLAVVIAIAFAFVLLPVSLPQLLGAFGILAAFTLGLTAICIHLSLVTIRTRIPLIPIVLMTVLVISYFDRNDDHLIRTLPVEVASADEAMPPRVLAGDAFLSWLRQRGLEPSKPSGGHPFPVFVVTAQGGGIYAAYNAAVFLSRMQDLCPTFRRHLFAISAVSGGSVGASLFATALDAASKDSPQPEMTPDDPCPLMTRFLSNAHADENLDKVGAVEADIDLALSTDFLSPLLAATLFPDFAQSVIPYPLGFLDRARALEYALESGADQMYLSNPSTVEAGRNSPGVAQSSETNLSRKSFQAHWSPAGTIPALLLNAADSGTGKRVIISPFDLEKAQSVSSDVCVLSANKKSEDFALSTAAFVSARFPWVTPAATTDLFNACLTDKPAKKIRLVDGGYIDNSGVETALDLIAEMKSATKAATVGDEPAVDPYPIYLISLSSGDFPSRRDYSLNELMEPIRALLNGREARAAIALNRASIEFRIVKVKGVGAAELPRFNRTNLQNYFYDLPLGWAMSGKTREIIALDSGRFWDCEPDLNFSQTIKGLSNADCVQLQIYHLLNNSATAAMVGLEQSNTTAAKMAKIAKSEGEPRERIDHEKLLACFESQWQAEKLERWTRNQTAFRQAYDNWHGSNWRVSSRPIEPTPYRKSYLSHYQAEHVRELLREWDRLGSAVDDKMLAYVLGSISYDSDDFRRTSENLSYKTGPQILKSPWRSRIKSINEFRKKQVPPVGEVDLNNLINNPEGFAELVWGWEGNHFGNNWRSGIYDPTMKDGWKFRSRGIYQIVGREQFEQESSWLKQTNARLDDNLLVDQPDALWNRTISAKVALSHFLHWKSPGITEVKDDRTKQRLESSLVGKTLSAVLSEHAGDFKLARLNQTDMGVGELEKVVRRSEMFRGCLVNSSGNSCLFDSNSKCRED